MEGQATGLRVSADRARPGVGRKTARALLVVVMALGSLFLWTVVPFSWLRLVASFSNRYPTIYVLALVGCPVAMLLWGWGLYRVNRVYLRLGGPRGESRPILLEALLVLSAVAAVIILVLWWVVLAHPPTSTPIPDEFSGGPS